MSGSEVPYHLRQNKHVDRQLFMEILSHVDRFMPVRNALYVSFGGVYFEDHKLLHNLFGSEKLYSLESEEWVHRRQLANRPFGCIECVHAKSGKFISGLADIRDSYGNVPIICWFDYTSPIQRRQQLEEFNMLLKASEKRDVVRVTINANASQLALRETGESVESLTQRRLAKLREQLGDKLTAEVDAADLTDGKFSRVLQQLVKLEAAAALRSQRGLVFKPLGSYSYSDSEHVMLTVTGIVLDQGEIAKFEEATGLTSFPFQGLDWELRPINVPLLSAREKLMLDQAYVAGVDPATVADTLTFQVAEKKEDSLNRLKAYFDFHRFYPHFHRIQY